MSAFFADWEKGRALQDETRICLECQKMPRIRKPLVKLTKKYYTLDMLAYMAVRLLCRKQS